MGITIKEIAELAGCSRGSVDRALKNSPNIKKETRDKILQIAEKYNYKPNIVGQALALSKKKYKIAVVVNSLGNDFFDEILRGLGEAEQYYKTYGVELEIFELEKFSAEKQLDAIDSIDWTGLNALIITAVDDVRLAARLKELAENGISILNMNSDTDFEGKITYVGCDYIKSGKTAGGLIKIISRNDECGLCIITGSANIRGHNQRVKGILEVISGCKNITNFGVVACNDNEEESYLAIKKVLEENSKINIICGAAGGVVGAHRAVEASKRDIKIMAFDNTEKINKLLEVGKIVATVNQQPYEQGYLAVKTLYEYDFAKIVPSKVINTELIIRIKENVYR